jgi:integrase
MAGRHFVACLQPNLHRLGVSDMTIQRILRHANVGVTQACYIKSADSDAKAAMQQLKRSLEYAPSMHLLGSERDRV